MRKLILTSTLLALATGCSGGGGENIPGPENVPEFGGLDRSYTVVGTAADGLDVPRDLAFHPDRPDELWTVNRATDGTVIYTNPGTASQSAQAIVDIYAYHFMEEVSGISFGAANTFGTCQESRNTYNGQAAPNDFMGPALWSADLTVYGQPGDGDLGSHLDMLHQSPLCMGIAHDSGNAYWVFDGMDGHVVYYDFQADHGPGHDDHADGIVRRYPEVALTRLPDVLGDMALDPATGILYVADTGTGRVLWMDTNTGSKKGNLSGANEPLAEYSEWTGVEHGVLANGLEEPAGVSLSADGRLFVSDHANGTITVYDTTTRKPLGRLDTPAEGIQGVEVGPDGFVWYVDATRDELVRIDPGS